MPPKDQAPPTYYRFSVAELPDELFSVHVPVEKWLGKDPTSTNEDTTTTTSSSSSATRPWLTTTTSKDGFEPGQLQNYGVPTPIPTSVEIERCVGIALYMIGNVVPFLLPLLAILSWWGVQYARTCLLGLIVYVSVLFAAEYFCFYPHFHNYYRNVAANAAAKNNSNNKNTDKVQTAQYLWTERNTTKYLSMSYVWPSDLNLDQQKQKNAIFCLIPHGLAPYGIVGYPVWSKLWNSLTCHWTCAPVILTLPIIGKFMKKMGYIPAKSKSILSILQKGDNVGIILDGIDGMFHNNTAANNTQKEVGCILSRKGIVKIALKAGTPIIPIYGFGHTLMYTVWVDPFGILQFLSTKLGVSLTPFFGRWMWPLGPPHRQVVTVCLGTPIVCDPTDDPTQAQIDEHHQKLLDGFRQTFDRHKVGFYGKAKGADKELVFVK